MRRIKLFKLYELLNNMENFKDEADKILKKTKLEPVCNGYQYLIVFLLSITLSTIVQFFSTRKYDARNTTNDVYGFLPYLSIYYKSLYALGPSNFMNFSESNFISLNSWFIGCCIAGTTALSILFISDIILQIVYTNEDSI
jgi:membrane-associated HD superfamily phosphohydrolase